MRITIDKIEAHPPHAFSGPELRTFLRLLPAGLLRDVSHVRLSNATHHSVAFNRVHFSRLEHRLVVASCGREREATMREIIGTLVQNNRTQPTGYGHGQSANSERQILTETDAVLATVMPKMPAPYRWIRAELKWVPPRKHPHETATD